MTTGRINQIATVRGVASPPITRGQATPLVCLVRAESAPNRFGLLLGRESIVFAKQSYYAPTARARRSHRCDCLPESLRVVARLLILWEDESSEGRARSLCTEPKAEALLCRGD